MIPLKSAASRSGTQRESGENHRSGRIGWLRASVLGANDGLVSTASLVVGIAASGASAHGVLVTGVAGLVAGAMSMAAGEYVSVHSQADTEAADLSRERRELAADPAGEHRELAAVYVSRGLELAQAEVVATQLMKHDALAAHARDELGISAAQAARPVQAALASAASFSVGALLPLAVIPLTPLATMGLWISAISLLALGGLGALAAQIGGADLGRGAIRVMIWGGLAMAVTAAVGKLFGTVAT